MYPCPECGSTDWILGREHTVWEMFHVTAVREDGTYTERDCGDFGETIGTSDWQEITCEACGEHAPADHPLWPRKEN